MKILFLLQNNVKIYKYVMEKKHFFFPFTSSEVQYEWGGGDWRQLINQPLISAWYLMPDIGIGSSVCKRL